MNGTLRSPAESAVEDLPIRLQPAVLVERTRPPKLRTRYQGFWRWLSRFWGWLAFRDSDSASEFLVRATTSALGFLSEGDAIFYGTQGRACLLRSLRFSKRSSLTLDGMSICPGIIAFVRLHDGSDAQISVIRRATGQNRARAVRVRIPGFRRSAAI